MVRLLCCSLISFALGIIWLQQQAELPNISTILALDILASCAFLSCLALLGLIQNCPGKAYRGRQYTNSSVRGYKKARAFLRKSYLHQFFRTRRNSHDHAQDKANGPGLASLQCSSTRPTSLQPADQTVESQPQGRIIPYIEKPESCCVGLRAYSKLYHMLFLSWIGWHVQRQLLLPLTTIRFAG